MYKAYSPWHSKFFKEFPSSFDWFLTQTETYNDDNNNNYTSSIGTLSLLSSLNGTRDHDLDTDCHGGKSIVSCLLSRTSVSFCLNVTDWSQSSPNTQKSLQTTLSPKTPCCFLLPSCIKVAVSTKPQKPVLGKPTGVPLWKVQKVAHIAHDCGLDPMLYKNTVVLQCVSLLLASSSALFLASASPPLLYLRCLKLVLDVMTCSK